ncbi:hypothetical protein CBOM_04573 [Ceraceosorus bombacis]|uniref:Uncharacterized protein n=1 Tax=Ceraceosorus bombacis TaxID=401625 RepID=A0A0P1BNX6_9BASI|nr:hypothetical protein CBOM_04573 [Ceraceosorus bombacis]
MHLQTSLTNQSVWRALTAKPTLGQQITRLTIKQTSEDLQERPVPDDVIPEALEAAVGALASTPVPDVDVDVASSASIEEQKLARAVSAEESLLEAMQAMSQLREFSWSTHPPVLSLPVRASKSGTDVWQTLCRVSASTLERLIVLDAAEFPALRGLDETTAKLSKEQGEAADPLFEKRSSVHDGSLFDQSFPQLKTFEYTCYSFKHGTVDPPTGRLANFLSGSTQLETLELHFFLHGARFSAPCPAWSADIGPVLSLDFAKLKILRVTDSRASAKSLAAFLIKHEASLEVIGSQSLSVESTSEDELGQGELSQWHRRGNLQSWTVEGVAGPALRGLSK